MHILDDLPVHQAAQFALQSPNRPQRMRAFLFRHNMRLRNHPQRFHRRKQSETLSICHRAYILNNGQVIAAGEPEQLLNDKEVRKVYLGESFSL